MGILARHRSVTRQEHEITPSAELIEGTRPVRILPFNSYSQIFWLWLGPWACGQREALSTDQRSLTTGLTLKGILKGGGTI
jgi:hypothetical protein